MPVSPAAIKRFGAIPNLNVLPSERLAPHTRFQIGGPAALFCDTADAGAFTEALQTAKELALPRMIIGGGTNLVISDAGFDGVVLRYTGSRIQRDGLLLHVEAGALLQSVVDQSIALGLQGLQTMTGIPGYLGGAVYGNAGAYGRSIEELVERVHVTDGDVALVLGNHECRFRYRDSIFKDRKNWIVLSAELRFENGEPLQLAKTAAEIRTIRDSKYPPMMKCAGSIFKNLFFRDLPARVQSEIPASVVREGKVPSAWFLEQIGAKGLRRGDIQVASYHANLIYNDGAGTASDLVAVIQDLKNRVRARFAIELEEEVQYLGFEYADALA
ncbi:MAG TPA: UDP-N-acetylmuramate dehydrogenase [Bryobacteraceae bacterium]|jgi:UDP-N-acetylmuramate dehydrogenase|nr:UDP-N-acetylmuramate dehydrogenase [Bryobacteraceae bacterium]